MKISIVSFLTFASIVLLALEIPTAALAQTGDCKRAENIVSTNQPYHAKKHTKGYGRYQEAMKFGASNKPFVYKEAKSKWYSFTAEKTAELSILLSPDSTKEDFDILLFRDTNATTCLDILVAENAPIRVNLSTKKGKTGFTADGKKDLVFRLANNEFSNSLAVNKGDKFYVLVNTTLCKGGYTLNFDYEEPKMGGVLASQKPDTSISVQIVSLDKNTKPTSSVITPSNPQANTKPVATTLVVPKPTAPKPVAQPVASKTTTTPKPTPVGPIAKVATTKPVVKPITATMYKINGTVNDAQANKAIEATIILQDTLTKTTISTYKVALDKGTYTFSLKSAKNIEISCYAGGYKFERKMLYELTFDSITKVCMLNFKLSPLKVNDNLIFTRINFYPSNASFLPESKPELEQLLTFMKVNKNILVEIQGHVNNPKNISQKFSTELSDKRARSILNYLIINGIEKERLTSKGYGNSKMLYPNPKNEEEAIQNRRVEVVVLDTK